MITNVTTTTTGTAGADAMKKSTGMNKDDFLRLFVTQLQNQDPLNPQDGTQFIGQLAQLTQVEQAYNANSNLQSLLNQGNGNMAMSSVSLIGKEVQAPGSQVALTAAGLAPVNFNLAQAANEVTVTVKDGNGVTIKTIKGGPSASGQGSLVWDGTNNDGIKAAPGVYSFSVSAKDASGNNVTGTPLIRGRVDGVDMSGAVPILSLGGIRLSLTELTSVSEGA